MPRPRQRRFPRRKYEWCGCRPRPCPRRCSPRRGSEPPGAGLSARGRVRRRARTSLQTGYDHGQYSGSFAFDATMQSGRDGENPTFDQVMVLAAQHQVEQVRLRRCIAVACARRQAFGHLLAPQKWSDFTFGKQRACACAQRQTVGRIRTAKWCTNLSSGVKRSRLGASFHLRMVVSSAPRKAAYSLTCEARQRLHHDPSRVLLSVWMCNCHVWLDPLPPQNRHVDLRSVFACHPPLGQTTKSFQYQPGMGVYFAK